MRRQTRIDREFPLEHAMALGVRLTHGVAMEVEDLLVKTRDRRKNVAGQRVFIRLLDFHGWIVSDILLHRRPLIISVKRKKMRDGKHGRGISPCNLNNINRVARA